MNPFVPVLGDAAAELSPGVRRHFLQQSGESRYRGVMERIWVRGGLAGGPLRAGLWLASRLLELAAPGPASSVPFELQHRVFLRGSTPVMSWRRTFHYPTGPAVFSDEIRLEDGVAVDWLGRGFPVLAELHVVVREGELHMEPGRRQWLRLGRLRAPIPGPFQVRATVREWEAADGALQIEVRISSPILGDLCGYRGWFAPVYFR